MMKIDDLQDIIKSFLGSALVVLLLALGIGNYIYTIFLDSSNVFTFHINIYFLIFILISIGLIIIYFFVFYSRINIYNEREIAMKANVKLLKKKEPKDIQKRYILSTRVSFWPSTESSPTRTEFRDLLTKRIDAGTEIKRIWQIRCKDDLDKLELYLERYKSYDNLSMKYLMGNFPLPEILSVYGEVVSISIPQPSDPRKLTTAFHFHGKKEILRWEGYFKILWESAIPLKIGDRIYPEEIKKLKNELHKSQ
ncbi:hypothetical protein BEH94_07385 [Candidatus Altiarchaeales archaeon WOR_SM1_SCG]|nr:hypothetical protein BEH94_07385 [Candidatus Altiarchaeales archaeon WOR_SM1_SCG]